MRKEHQKPQHISQTIKEIFNAIDQKDTHGAGEKKNILDVWGQIVGEKAEKHCTPTNIKNNTLIVNVDSTIWIYQLQLKKQDILKKVKEHLDEKNINNIRFRAGAI